MALSTSAQAVLDQLALLPAPPDFATITPEQEVEYIQASRAATSVPREGEDVAQVHNVTVDASGCAARIYVPDSAVRDAGIIVHFHGGGWLTGSIEMSDDACRFLANRSGRVVFRGYRFAPEHPSPPPPTTRTRFQWARPAGPSADGTRVATIGTSAGATPRHRPAYSRRGSGTAGLPVFVYPPLARHFNRSRTRTGLLYLRRSDRWFWSPYAVQASREDPLLHRCTRRSRGNAVVDHHRRVRSVARRRRALCHQLRDSGALSARRSKAITAMGLSPRAEAREC